MRKIKRAAALGLFILILAFLIKKEKSLPSNEYYTTTTGLNVRTGIGKKYPISFTLDKGDKVEILSKKRSWYEIEFKGKTGYAHSKFIVKKYDIKLETEFPSSSQRKGVFLFISIGVLICISIPIIYRKYKKQQDRKLIKTVTELDRGTPSERDLILKLLKNKIPQEDIFHDLYIKTNNNTFSQIDLVLITEVGIIVFEIKDYSGWIFGKGTDPQWTQVLAHGKQKYRFQNPITQNSNHITHLKTRLDQYKHLPFYSIIVFYGESVLKNINFVPRGTLIVKSTRIIEAIKTIIYENNSIEYTDKNDLVRILKEATVNGRNIEIQNQHIENIRDMLGTDRIFD